jgi:hypothetical protein
LQEEEEGGSLWQRLAAGAGGTVEQLPGGKGTLGLGRRQRPVVELHQAQGQGRQQDDAPGNRFPGHRRQVERPVQNRWFGRPGMDRIAGMIVDGVVFTRGGAHVWVPPLARGPLVADRIE